MPLLLTCPSGHQWQIIESASFPADMQVACPVCSLSVSLNDSQSTISCPTPFEAAAAKDSARPELEHTTDSRDHFPGFDILNELGRGGMGVVYRAFDRARKETVALKTVKYLDSAAVYRFKQEFRTLADITHPNLVTLHELLSDGQEWFFTMELVEGSDFLTYVRSATDRFNCLRETLQQLVAGVSVLHRAGILHRDIKPSNVRVTREGRIVLLDFGLAARMEESGQYQTIDQHVVGTFAYMAPEQGRGLPVSPASDWYSVGVMIYQALTGELPFSGNSYKVLVDKQRIEAPPPCELAVGLPIDLNALCIGLLRRDPKERLGEQQVRELLNVPAQTLARDVHLPARERMPLLGREEQLAALREAFQSMRAGQAVSLYLHGRSGMGKTALMQHFLHDLAQSKQAVVLAGRCYEHEAVPYKALDSLIDALSHYLRQLPNESVQALLPRDVHSLVRVFPVLGQIKAIAQAPHPPLDIPDQQELRRHAVASLRELLSRIADRWPVVLAIDDLQWGDVDSGVLLLDLLRPPDSPALLLICSYRSEDVDTSPCLKLLLNAARKQEWIRDQRSIEVESLSPADSRKLALKTLGRIDSTMTILADRIAQEAAGDPLFVQELVRHIQEQVAQSSPGELAPPMTTLDLENVLWARIQRLPEPAYKLLEVIAVAGRPLIQLVACQAAELGPESWGILALLRSERLIRGSGMAQSERLETYHDRIRETVVANLAPQVSKDCHRRLAEALEVAAASDPEELAVHYEASGEIEKAARYFAIAAAQATKALAFERAARLCRLALEFWPPSREDKWHLQVQLADALANAGRGAEAANEYLAATSSAPAVQILELRHRAATQYLISGHTEDGMKAMKATCAAVGINLPGTPRSALFSYLWNRTRLWIRGRRFHERPPSEIRAEDLARLDICWSAALGLSNIHPICGAALHARHLLLAIRTGEPYRVLLGLAMEIGLSALAGGKAAQRTARIAENAETLARHVSHPHGLAVVRLARGAAAFYEGRWKIALQLAQEAEKILREQCPGAVYELDTAHIVSLYALYHMGTWTDLNRQVSLLLREAQERGDLYALVHLGIVHRPVLQCWADDPDGAQRELDERMAQCTQEGFPFMKVDALFAQIHIDLYCGRVNKAKQRLAELQSALSGSLLMRIQLFRIHFWEVGAQIALTEAVTKLDRRRLLHDATACAARMEHENIPWAQPTTQSIRAGVALLLGDHLNGVALLASAVHGFEAAEMRQYAAAARRRLGELLGGEEGQTLIEQADSWMKSQMVKNPVRVAHYFQPVGDQEQRNGG